MSIEVTGSHESESGAQDAPARVRWTGVQIYVLLLLVLVNVSNYLDRGVLAILQEPMKHDLKLQDWQLGFLGGPAFAIFYSLAGIPTARVAERLNRISVLAIALSFWSIMTALCGAAGNFAQLAAARLGVGAGEGACSPISHSLISDVFPPRQRGRALSILTTSIPIGHLLAPVVGAIAATALGWRVAFILVGIPGVLLAILLRLTVREPRNDIKNVQVSRAAPTRFLDDIGLLVRNRAFVWLFVATAFMGVAVTSMNVFTASFFVRTYHMSLAQVGAVIAVGVGAAGLVGTFVGGYLADRFAGDYGRSYPFVVGAAAGLAGIFYFITFAQSSWSSAFAFLLIANIASDMKNGPNFAAVQNMSPPHMRTTAAAVIMIAVVVIGSGLGGLSVGIASDLGAARHFPAALGAFATICPGGKALPGASASLMAACMDASAKGLRLGMIVPCVAYLVAAPCYFLSGLAIREKLAR